MTQKCQHDEQLLDYVYGELSDAERKIFADHLVTCNTCPAQVQSFGHVRQEFQQRPPIEPAGEAMQRMTALLMQAAAAEHGKAAATAADGGGKVLAFRARGLRRILFHPASSVMAVAAAALFWVVFHAPPIPESGLSAPTSPASFEPARPTPGAATPATTLPIQAAVTKNDPRAEVAATAADNKAVAEGAGLGADKGSKGDQDGDFDGLRGGSRFAEKKAVDTPLAKAEPPAKPTMVAKEESYAAAGKGAAARPRADVQYRGSGPAIVTMADQAYAKAKKFDSSVEAERPADRQAPPTVAPPPPPRATPPAAAKPREDETDTSVREGLTRTQERVQQKMVDDLANQALAGMNSSANSVPPVPPPANVHRYAQGGSAISGSTSHNDNVESPQGRSYAYNNQNEQAPTPAAAPSPSATGVPSREPVTGAAPDEHAAALTTAKEQLRRGQCSDANTTLTRLERTAPQLYGLTEARADWQSACAAPAPQQALERRMNLEAAEPAAQMSSPKRAVNKQRLASPAAPSPSKAPPRKPTKANADAL